MIKTASDLFWQLFEAIDCDAPEDQLLRDSIFETLEELALVSRETQIYQHSREKIEKSLQADDVPQDDAEKLNFFWMDFLIKATTAPGGHFGAVAVGIILIPNIYDIAKRLRDSKK